jgi:hypothetical protein
MFHQQDSYGDRCFVSTANGLSVHSYLSLSPVIKEFYTKQEEHMRSPSTEPHEDGRLAYSGVQLGSTGGSFKTLL